MNIPALTVLAVAAVTALSVRTRLRPTGTNTPTPSRAATPPSRAPATRAGCTWRAISRPPSPPRPPTRPGRPTASPSPSPTRAASGSSPPRAARPTRSPAAPATTPSPVGRPTAAKSPTPPTSIATSTSSSPSSRPDGSRRLTTHPFLDLRPRWSPDGSRILFTTERDGTFDLWVHGMETGMAEAVIADREANDMAGDWIGDTGDIVFVSRRGEAALGSGSLWRYRGATGVVELLIRVETNYQAAPVVAPQGGIVAYVTDSSGQQRPLHRPQREVPPRNPARAPHPQPHG